MRVRFLRDWAGPQHAFQPAGTEAEVDQATARLLFAGEIAEPVSLVESATIAPRRVAARVTKPPPRRKARR
jgi:hypothetical protein